MNLIDRPILIIYIMLMRTNFFQLEKKVILFQIIIKDNNEIYLTNNLNNLFVSRLI